jgi:hypothetical protein
MNTKKDIEKMMVDVRKAHRLLFQYQDRMKELMNRVSTEFNLGPCRGRKRFSNPIGNTSGGDDYPDANLRIHDRWAWDWLYPYEFEYYFGRTQRNDLSCCFSIFQVSDNGYYLADGYHRNVEGRNGHISKTKVEGFWPVEESSSYLIFSFECFPRTGHRFFFKQPKDSIVKLYGGDESTLIIRNETNTLIAKRYNIEEFFSRESVTEILTHFSKIVKEETNFELKPE